ncbi:MAG: RNB domain-containing ribonuclease [Acidobacteriota bacterium]|nr:RNB domain-containing ribonuclease [Acidobacteriota bacterium]
MTQPSFNLVSLAAAEMIREGFHPGFPAGTDEQIAAIRAASTTAPGGDHRDLRGLWWSSIDNDTSRDLDQIEAAERVAGGIRLLVGVAEVSRAVKKGTPIDQHAADQTQTIYTAVRNFPMLPNELSTDLTSLNENQDRAAVVVEMVVDAAGDVSQPKIYRALVRNKAQLAYSKVGPWLEGTAPPDAKVAAHPELQQQLKLQDEAAQALHAGRVRCGALEFHRTEADPVVVDGKVQGLKAAIPNRATSLIEELMVAANEVMAETLRAAKRSCLRRVVKSPERWERIVELVRSHGTELPETPDSTALNVFLRQQRTADPDHYPDLALAIIKLMGPGEYVLLPGNAAAAPSHFGLAAHDYTHSTAPNRRFPDLVTQRVVKAMLAGAPAPYTDGELESLAQHCTEREAAARKVQRTMAKREAAVALAGHVGQTFRGVVTGANDKGTYVRVFDPPAEGRVVRGEAGLDVGDRVQVTLLHTDPVHAHIDFARS